MQPGLENMFACARVRVYLFTSTKQLKCGVKHGALDLGWEEEEGKGGGRREMGRRMWCQEEAEMLESCSILPHTLPSQCTRGVLARSGLSAHSILVGFFSEY